ncbi:sugar phosphate isomerase/epimerase [Sphingobium lactosutens]|uniref:sugar phosphate isomerase/epimerase family protein n=1 Tax=Sphingobium lactosutens TaxID=522773 RepID=UPI0015BF92DC|nr:TIM barrel protein [Sphingobium lactosutens]NWK98725.1 sugar phosphate isomerase/epimerase [Sphingobium lactosutens]
MRILSLAAGVLPDQSPEEVVEAGAAAGFAAVGLRIDGQDWTGERIGALKARIAELDLILLDAEVLWIRPGEPDPALLDLVDVAAALGACNLLAVSSDPDRQATAEKFGALCDRAAPAGVPVALEFGLFTAVHRLADAQAVVGVANRPNGHVLVDPLHLSRSGGTASDAAAIPGTLLRYAQFCDAGPDVPDPTDIAAIRAEALDGRLLPGEGVLPLDALLRGWPADLPLSIELRSKTLREAFPDPTERARHLRERTEAWFARRSGRDG